MEKKAVGRAWPLVSRQSRQETSLSVFVLVYQYSESTEYLWSVTTEEACIRDVQPEVSRVGCEKQEVAVHNCLRLRLVYQALSY
jgi:hypothetical protein